MEFSIVVIHGDKQMYSKKTEEARFAPLDIKLHVYRDEEELNTSRNVKREKIV